MDGAAQEAAALLPLPLEEDEVEDELEEDSFDDDDDEEVDDEESEELAAFAGSLEEEPERLSVR